MWSEYQPIFCMPWRDAICIYVHFHVFVTIIQLLRELLVTVNKRLNGNSQKAEDATGDMDQEALDCVYAAIDVIESIMEERFIRNLGPALERPFDQTASVALFESLALCLHFLVAAIRPLPRAGRPTADSNDDNTIPPTEERPIIPPKSFTILDEKGTESVIWKSRGYDPLQYLLVVLYLMSHTSIQTDVTCFWWDPKTIIEVVWKEENLRALLKVIDLAMEKVSLLRYP